MSDLNARQTAFVKEYAVDRNATQAAIRAGYSAKTAAQQASDLLRNPKVRAEVEIVQQTLAEKVGLKAEGVLKIMMQVTSADVRRLVDDGGAPIPLHQLDDDIAMAVQSVDIVPTPHGHAYRYRMCDRNAAAEKLMKHLGLFEKDNSQKKDAVTDLIEAIRGGGSRLPLRPPEA